MPDSIAVREVSTPIGALRVASTPRGIVRLAFPRATGKGFRGWLERHLPGASTVDWLPPLDKLAAELEEYFAGRRTAFTGPGELRGTPFQRSVWQHLLEIPYGELRSYGQVARKVGRPRASRAVGAASGANPVPILVPCHRVIASNGRLTGYGGGLNVKRKLLALERARLPQGSLL